MTPIAQIRALVRTVAALVLVLALTNLSWAYVSQAAPWARTVSLVAGLSGLICAAIIWLIAAKLKDTQAGGDNS